MTRNISRIPRPARRNRLQRPYRSHVDDELFDGHRLVIVKVGWQKVSGPDRLHVLAQEVRVAGAQVTDGDQGLGPPVEVVLLDLAVLVHVEAGEQG